MALNASAVRRRAAHLSDRAGYTLLAAGWLAHAAVNFAWLKVDTRPRW